MAVLKPKEMAELLNVTVKTLKIWDKKGLQKLIELPLIEDIIRNNT